MPANYVKDIEPAKVQKVTKKKEMVSVPVKVVKKKIEKRKVPRSSRIGSKSILGRRSNTRESKATPKSGHQLLAPPSLLVQCTEVVVQTAVQWRLDSKPSTQRMTDLYKGRSFGVRPWRKPYDSLVSSESVTKWRCGYERRWVWPVA